MRGISVTLLLVLFGKYMYYNINLCIFIAICFHSCVWCMFVCTVCIFLPTIPVVDVF